MNNGENRKKREEHGSALARTALGLFGLLVVLAMGVLALRALHVIDFDEPKLPAMAGIETPAPTPSEPEIAALYVDGTMIEHWGVSPDGTRHYAEKTAFLAALDEGFWAGEKESFDPPSFTQDGIEYMSVEDFCAEHGIATYGEGPDKSFWCTSAAGDWEVPAGVTVPVLMYHGVGNETWTTKELFVSPMEMEQQLIWLKQRGYTPIWFSDLKHVDQYERPVILTFDDGFEDNYTVLYPLLKKYRVKATLLVVTGNLDSREEVLTREQVKELADSDLVEVQCHTQYHKDLDELSYQEQKEELTWSKVELLKLTNRQPYVIAYPEGRQNGATLAICRDEYRFGLKMSGKVYETGDEPLLIYRIYVPRGLDPWDFGALLPSTTEVFSIDPRAQNG